MTEKTCGCCAVRHPTDHEKILKPGRTLVALNVPGLRRSDPILLCETCDRLPLERVRRQLASA